MDINNTIAKLYEEKTRLDIAIASLEQLAEDASPMPSTALRRGRKFMSVEERQAVSERMRKYWAGRKPVRQEEAQEARV